MQEFRDRGPRRQRQKHPLRTDALQGGRHRPPRNGRREEHRLRLHGGRAGTAREHLLHVHELHVEKQSVLFRGHSRIWRIHRPSRRRRPRRRRRAGGDRRDRRPAGRHRPRLEDDQGAPDSPLRSGEPPRQGARRLQGDSRSDARQPRQIGDHPPLLAGRFGRLVQPRGERAFRQGYSGRKSPTTSPNAAGCGSTRSPKPTTN